MTVTYQTEVASIRSFGVFWKLLFRWKGSIYKLVWPDLTLYIVLYFTLNMSYRFVMNEHHRKLFEEVSRYCANFSTFIPMSFVLGFYVTIVVNRWWEQYMAMPWPDPLAVFVSTNIQGNDDRGRLMRRTIMRYVNLSFVYTMSQMCTRVKLRFPTLDHLVEAGIMTDTEKKIFELMNKKTPHLKYWMPLVWAGSIVTKARKEGRIRDDFAVKTLVDSINTFRSGLGNVLNYDWISVPLVYTQTVTLAVYTFFMAELMGRQFVKGNDPDDETIDLYVPVFTFLQFFFYMGWLRVAETLFNPFGDDDDDFEINWLIDRNLQVSYIIVDEMHEDHPELVRDQYWEDVIPAELPYTVAAEQYRGEPPQGSAAQIDVKQSEMVVSEGPPPIPEEEEVRTLVMPKDVEAAPSSVLPEGVRPSVTSAMDIGVSGSPGPAGDQREADVVSGDSRLSAPLNTASIKRSVLGLMHKVSNKVRDVPTTVLATRSSSRASNDSRRTNPQPSSATREDELFLMSDLDLAADSHVSLPPDGTTVPPVELRPASSASSEEAAEVGPPQRRPSASSEGSEERAVPKFLPGDYNFLITTVPEEEEEEVEEEKEVEATTVAEPEPPPPVVAPSVQLANVLSTTFQPPAEAGSGEQPQTGQQSLLTQLITTIIEAAGGTVQPRPPIPSPPPSPTAAASPEPPPPSAAPDPDSAVPAAAAAPATNAAATTELAADTGADLAGDTGADLPADPAADAGSRHPHLMARSQGSLRVPRQPLVLSPESTPAVFSSSSSAGSESEREEEGRRVVHGTREETVPASEPPGDGLIATEAETGQEREQAEPEAEYRSTPPEPEAEDESQRVETGRLPDSSSRLPTDDRGEAAEPATEEGDSLADDSSVAPLLPGQGSRRRHATDSSEGEDPSASTLQTPLPEGDDS